MIPNTSTRRKYTMSSSIVLIGLIAAVALMHLTANTVHALARLRGGQPQVMAAGGKRGDWYMFFHCSDLTGRETAGNMTDRDERRQVAGPTPTQRDSARRPRARLSL
jgi:hypothetical protein